MTHFANKQSYFLSLKIVFKILGMFVIVSCNTQDPETSEQKVIESPKQQNPVQQKIIIYQVLPRLFGNKTTTNKPWGTIEENGVGKFNDFNHAALQSIKDLGISHIWYTGVLHHAVIRDYTEIGIENDDPDVVKGRAGSPYAIKDYYNVNPDLAVNPKHRLEEFKQLIDRTHQHDMKVIIDIVPNHVARNYHSISAPEGVKDFGEDDDKTVLYKKHNNFYYVVGEDFKVPSALKQNPPLGGEKHILADNHFAESPAKWTGNNSRASQPDINDWYETVKINFGISENGKKDFPLLPEGYENKSHSEHYLFWKDKSVPSSWIKYRDIALFWLDFGVDGFRYDMAEMVPVEFWSYFNSAIKHKKPDAYLIAEIYNPKVYRDYIDLGKMDAIYDKVEIYDSLKLIMQNKESTDVLVTIQQGLNDIENHILHFLENHDEQRIASKDFAGNPDIAKPAMVVSALINSGPTLLYFAQELGEAGDGDAGFGKATRSSIFDYWGVPSQQRWMNQGKFDGEKLSDKEATIRNFYSNILNIAASSEAVVGDYLEIHSANKNTVGYNDRLFSFVRWKNNKALIVVSNFDAIKEYNLQLVVPKIAINSWGLEDGNYSLIDRLDEEVENQLIVNNGVGQIQLKLNPLKSFVYELVIPTGKK